MEHLFSLGSMVQKGKFSAGAALFVRMLKNVDFPKLKKKITCKVSEVTIWIKWSIPTLGSPTIPTFKLVPTRPIRGLGSGAAFFLGGIFNHLREVVRL